MEWSHPHVAVKNQERYLSYKDTPLGVRGPNPIPGPPAQGSRARKRSPITSDYKNQQGV